jgi:hypothetical protein
MPDFRSRSKRRAEANVTVSAASAGLSYFYGYTGRTLQAVKHALHVKPEAIASLPPSRGPRVSNGTSTILQFAAGDVSYADCFGMDDQLPVKDEKPESTSAGIKTAPKKARNLNSVSLGSFQSRTELSNDTT